VSKIELSETQFERTVRDKITITSVSYSILSRIIHFEKSASSKSSRY